MNHVLLLCPLFTTKYSYSEFFVPLLPLLVYSLSLAAAPLEWYMCKGGSLSGADTSAAFQTGWPGVFMSGAACFLTPWDEVHDFKNVPRGWKSKSISEPSLLSPLSLLLPTIRQSSKLFFLIQSQNLNHRCSSCWSCVVAVLFSVWCWSFIT